MIEDLKNAYFVKNSASGTFTDITTLFDGVRVLKIDGFNKKGKAVNVYCEQWMDGSVDFMITTMDGNNNPVIVRELVDIEITFIVKQKYATSTIDVLTQHDSFVDYLTSKDVWVKSNYENDKAVHCVCIDEYKPTVEKLKRGVNSYMMGTIKLHTLEEPA